MVPSLPFVTVRYLFLFPKHFLFMELEAVEQEKQETTKQNTLLLLWTGAYEKIGACTDLLENLIVLVYASPSFSSYEIFLTFMLFDFGAPLLTLIFACKNISNSNSYTKGLISFF